MEHQKPCVAASLDDRGTNGDCNPQKGTLQVDLDILFDIATYIFHVILFSRVSGRTLLDLETLTESAAVVGR